MILRRGGERSGLDLYLLLPMTTWLNNMSPKHTHGMRRTVDDNMIKRFLQSTLGGGCDTGLP